jgi:hypothetical protein
MKTLSYYASIRNCHVRLHVAVFAYDHVLADVTETPNDRAITDFRAVTDNNIVPNNDVTTEFHVLSYDDAFSHLRLS